MAAPVPAEAAAPPEDGHPPAANGRTATSVSPSADAEDDAATERLDSPRVPGVRNSYKFLRGVEDDVLRMCYFATSVELAYSETSFCRVLDKFKNVLKVESAQDLRTVLGNRELANKTLKQAGRRCLRNRTYAILEKHLNRSVAVKGTKERKNALEVALEKNACFAPVPPNPALIPPVYTRPDVLDRRLSFASERLVNECTVELTQAHKESREVYTYLAKTTVPPPPTTRDAAIATTEMAALNAVQKEAEQTILNQEKLQIERRRQMREEAKERERRKLEAAKKPKKSVEEMEKAEAEGEEKEGEEGAPAEGAENAGAAEGESPPPEESPPP